MYFDYFHNQNITVSRIISLAIAGAPPMAAYVASPRGEGQFPGVIVFHDAFGVNAHIRAVADGLASEGCVAIVPQLFHRTAPEGYEARYYQASLAMSHYNALTPEHVDVAMRAAHKWLSNQANVNPRKLGAIGYSVGGRLAFIAAHTLGLQAVACFFPNMIQHEIARIPELKSANLFVWAGNDEYVTRQHMLAVVDGLRSAGRQHTSVEVSDAAHGFAFPGYPAYHPAAAAETWGLAKAFLKSRLA